MAKHVRKRRRKSTHKRAAAKPSPKPQRQEVRRQIEQTTREQVERALQIDEGRTLDIAQVDEANLEAMRRGRLVERLRRSEAWREIVQPLLDNMIAAVTGRKVNGRWQAGHFISSRRDREQQMHTGYAMALIEFNNQLEDIVKTKQALEREELERQNPKPEIDPMLEGEIDYEQEENIE